MTQLKLREIEDCLFLLKTIEILYINDNIYSLLQNLGIKIEQKV